MDLVDKLFSFLPVVDGRAFTFKLAFSPTPNLDKV